MTDIVPIEVINAVLAKYNVSYEDLNPLCISYITSLYKITKWKPNDALVREYNNSQELDKITGYYNKLKNLKEEKRSKEDTIKYLSDQGSDDYTRLRNRNNLLELKLELSSIECDIQNFTAKISSFIEKNCLTLHKKYEDYINNCFEFIQSNNIHDFTTKDIITTSSLNSRMQEIKQLLHSEIKSKRISVVPEQLLIGDYDPKIVLNLMKTDIKTERELIYDQLFPERTDVSYMPASADIIYTTTSKSE